MIILEPRNSCEAATNLRTKWLSHARDEASIDPIAEKTVREKEENDEEEKEEEEEEEKVLAGLWCKDEKLRSRAS